MGELENLLLLYRNLTDEQKQILIETARKLVEAQLHKDSDA